MLKDYPAPAKYDRLAANENTIYFVDYDMVQAEIQMILATRPSIPNCCL